MAPLPARQKATASKADARLVKLLSGPLLAEEQGAPRSVKCTPWIVAGFIVGCLGLAAVTEVSESAVVKGQIVPAGAVKVVQHLEGGIVAEILVDDGDGVSEGQALIRLDPAASMAELDEMRARAASLGLASERLRAFVLDRQADFTVGSNYPDLVRGERDTLEAQRRDRDNRRSVLRSRIRQKQAQIGALTQQRKYQKELKDIAKELVDMRTALLSKGLTSKITYLDTLRQYSEASAHLSENLGQVNKAEEDLAEAETNLLELDSQLEKDAQTELRRVSGELAQVAEALKSLEDRVTRLVIRSPSEGIVTGLAKKTVGAVIRPGETIMMVVPAADELVAEVRLAPRDIGHIEVGQPARVEVSTYDASIYGGVDGHLRGISASTFTDDGGNVFYKGIIVLERAYVGNEPDRFPILPGMEASGDVITGRRTLLHYVLKPIYRALDGAFHER